MGDQISLVETKFGDLTREDIQVNFDSTFESSNTVSTPIQFLPSNSPNAPVFQLIKSDGTPLPDSKAVEFTAAGSVTIPHFAGLDFTVDFTVDFWAFLDAAGQDTWILTKIPNIGSNIFRIKQISTGLDIEISGSNNVAANIGAWNHIVLAYDQSSNDLDVYVNAALQTTISIAFASNTNNWKLGARFAIDNQAWTGLVDELKMVDFHYQLSDVAASYNAGSGIEGTASTPGLINGYHFNDDLLDYSDNKNDGISLGTTGFNTGKVGDPLGGSGIFAYVFQNGKDQEMPIMIQVPTTYSEGDNLNIDAKAYTSDALVGNVDFEVLTSWTNIGALMPTPGSTIKSYSVIATDADKLLSTEADPIVIVPAPEIVAQSAILGLFRRLGSTDTFAGDVAILIMNSRFKP